MLVKILSFVLGIKDVFAATQLDYGTSSSGCGSGATFPNPLQSCSFVDLANRIVDFLLIVAAPIAIIMIIWAGLLYMTSGGNSERRSQANSTLLWTAIGIGILMISKGVTLVLASILGGH